MVNPQNERHVRKLRHAMDVSRQQLQHTRDFEKNALRQYLGQHYSDNAADDRVPINLLDLAITVYVAHLASGEPEASVAANFIELRQNAILVEKLVNHDMRQCRYSSAKEEAVMNSMFSMGILKVGMCLSESHALADSTIQYAKPYVASVDIEDWVHDPTAKRWEQIGFCGNRSYLPLEAVRDDPTFDPRVRNAVKAEEWSLVGEESGDDRLLSLFGDERMSQGEMLHEVCEVWDIWLPREQLVVTLAGGADLPNGGVLHVMEWDGPAHGMYHLLRYGRVSGNIVPKSPAQGLMDMHQLLNRLYTKLGRQAERQKNVTAYEAGFADDAERLREADDGDMVQVNSVNSIRTEMFGGVDQANLSFTLNAYQLAKQMAGNIDSLGGLGSAADTLGQEELMASAASKRMAEMQRRVIECDVAVVRDLAWYRFHDPTLNEQVSFEANGLQAPYDITPADMRGDAMDYNYKVNPASISMRTPEQQLEQMLQTYERIIMPNMELLMAQGGAPNIELMLEEASRLTGNDTLRNLVTFADPQIMRERPMGREGLGSSMPANTTRRYERISRRGSAATSPEEEMAYQMAGGTKAAQGGGFQ